MSTAEAKSNNGDESSREPIKAETARVAEAGGTGGWGVDGGGAGEEQGRKKRLSSALCSMVSPF